MSAVFDSADRIPGSGLATSHRRDSSGRDAISSIRQVSRPQRVRHGAPGGTRFAIDSRRIGGRTQSPGSQSPIPRNVFRYALRTLARSPAWTFAAVACLAIGIGANTTVYTAMRALVIAPVPTPNSERLVMLAETPPRNPTDPATDRLAPANLVHWHSLTATPDSR